MKLIDWIKRAIHQHRRWKIADRRGWACCGMALRSHDEKTIRYWARKANAYYRITRE